MYLEYLKGALMMCQNCQASCVMFTKLPWVGCKAVQSLKSLTGIAFIRVDASTLRQVLGIPWISSNYRITTSIIRVRLNKEMASPLCWDLFYFAYSWSSQLQFIILQVHITAYGFHIDKWVLSKKKKEKVQRRAAGVVQQLQNFLNKAKLRLSNLPTLKYRRLRGDMIQVYNIVSGKHNNHTTVELNLSHVSNTGGWR